MIVIEKDKIQFSFDKKVNPVAKTNSGEVVKFHCQDCYSEQLLYDGFDFKNIDMSRNNPVTGPLYIEGALPGDILKVEIQSINIAEDGCMSARTGSGIYEIEGCHCRRFPVRDGKILFDNGITLPIKPLIGVIGVAPKDEPISTQTPGEHGGNLDIKDLGEGTTLYLPVNVEGALLSMGDLHALQGDGETVICALEVSGDVTVKVTVLKNRNDIPTPFLVTKDKYITTASDPSLDICSVKAARKMHKFLQEHSSLNDAQSGLLLSLAGNLRISQVVNPSKGCIMDFPIGLTNEIFEL